MKPSRDRSPGLGWGWGLGLGLAVLGWLCSPMLLRAKAETGPGPAVSGSAAGGSGAPAAAAKADGQTRGGATGKAAVTAVSSTGGSPAPSGLPQEPSLYETGRVGKMGVNDSGARIKQTPEGAKPKELRVEGKATSPEPTAAPTFRGVLEASVFGRELRPRLALLRDCRTEVARHKRTDTASVTATALLLRWTVLPTGQVTDTQVVATSPVDGRVTDCVKRQMSLWSFSPPTGGPARVERPFRFR